MSILDAEKINRVAIIPARSGSRGLPNKNILDLCGQPVLCWSIDAALDSDLFERVIVSTDSEDYGRIASACGAEVMYRSSELSDSNATTFMVLQDFLSRLDEEPDWFMLLQPTSPLRDSSHIKDAVRVFESRDREAFDFLASVKLVEHDRSLICPIDDKGGLSGLSLDYSNYRRQASAEYTPNGAIYIAKPQAYLKQGHFFGSRSLAFPMDPLSSVDIDNDIDFELAKICMARKLGI